MSIRETLKTEMFDEIVRMHSHVLETLQTVSQQVGLGDGALLCDTIYVLKQAHKHIDDMRKAINRVLDVKQKEGCFAMLQHPEGKFEGEWASGTPLVTEQPYMPSSDDENYAAFMYELGVPDELAARGIVKPSFTGVQNLVAQYAAAGKPVPAALQTAKTIKRFTVVARSKRVID